MTVSVDVKNTGTGATRTVSFTLPPGELAFWDETKNGFAVEPGTYRIMVGKSSTDIQSTTTLKVK